MAHDGITFEQVAATADALMGQGQRPTIRAIRDALGTGSPNTVHKHLTAWREAHPQPVATGSALSVGLTSAFTAEIERAAAQARAEIKTLLAQAQTDAADLAGAGEVLEAEMAELVGRITALTSERDTIASKAAQQAADLSVQAQRIEREQVSAQAARLEAATARVKIEAQAEIERLRATLDENRHARQQAEQAIAFAVAAAKLGDMADRAAKAETRIKQMEKQTKTAVFNLFSANASVQARQTLIKSAARELDDAKKAAAGARAAVKESGKEAAELRSRLAATQPKAVRAKPSATRPYRVPLLSATRWQATGSPLAAARSATLAALK